MNITKEEELLCLVAIKRIGTYKQIAEYENITENEAKYKYKGIPKFYCNVLDITEDELLIFQDNIQNKKEQIDKLFSNQFSGNKLRNEGFGSFEKFYEWYEQQENKCYYCNISSKQLQELFSENKLCSSKFNSTLHIEQIDPKKGYNPDNCKLACCLCNNAKSDFISKENYKKYFAEAMSSFLNDLHKNKIKNITFCQ
jgi:hypothetical protein